MKLLISIIYIYLAVLHDLRFLCALLLGREFLLSQTVGNYYQTSLVYDFFEQCSGVPWCIFLPCPTPSRPAVTRKKLLRLVHVLVPQCVHGLPPAVLVAPLHLPVLPGGFMRTTFGLKISPASYPACVQCTLLYSCNSTRHILLCNLCC